MSDPNDDFSSDIRGDYGSKSNRTTGLTIVGVALILSVLIFFLWTRTKIDNPPVAETPPAAEKAQPEAPTSPAAEDPAPKPPDPPKIAEKPSMPAQPAETGSGSDSAPSLGDPKSHQDPEKLAAAVASGLTSGNARSLIKNLKSADLDPEQTKQLKAFVEKGEFEVSKDAPIELVGRVDGKTRFALDLSRPAVDGLPAEEKRVFVDVQKAKDGTWEIADLSLPDFTIAEPDPSGKTKIVTINPEIQSDAMTSAFKFFKALTTQDFASARALLDPTKVSEEKLVGLFIVTEDGQFRPHGQNPLVATSTGEEHAVIIAQLSNEKTTSDFGLQLSRDAASDQWLITDIALSKLISELAKASDADGLPYTPVVTNPQGGESLVIYFHYDTPELHDRATRQLAIIASILKSDPAKTIEINGHTDAKGSENYNVSLSDNRAASVKNQLIALDVDPTQILTEAYGEAKPFHPNLNPDGSDNPDGRKHNRRAEVYLNF
ncbi:MAG: OmpA family protein [Verrucomicrobiota bacterium]